MTEKIEVLLVDDEPIVGNRLKPALAKFGCNVEFYEDSKAAMIRIDEKEFDIIVSDIMMADVNGIQLLEYIQKKSDRTKVIMITGYATETLAREAMAKGARSALGSDLAIAVTGIAGPEGGSEEKPVGTVHVALSGPADDDLIHRRLHLPGDRERVRWMTSQWALEMLRRRALQS